MKTTCAAVGLGLLSIVLAACGTPQTATALVALGLEAQLAGDLTAAEANYQQAIKVDANSMVAHYDLGTIYDRHDKTSLAVGEYAAALVIDPTFTDALFNLAVDTATTDPSDAKTLYLKVVSAQPSFAAAWLNLGFILQAEGNTTAAHADWSKAVVLDPSFATRIPRATPLLPRQSPESVTRDR
ncbi:MAG TPA: tetratricopeptide repeat protein [Candidatus Saccharimonadales bacterium]|nr:tetratricopeptide repeat protein [Candidatus Saccharimonadales bacterium]